MLKPMKGAAIEDFGQIQFPIYGSPKIDGFRCVLSDRPLTSRLSPFPNRYFDTELKGLLPEPLLDSEVTVGNRKGPGVLQRTSSGLTSRDGEPDFTLWCFDTPQVGYNFRDRLQLTQQIVRHLNDERIRFLKHTLLVDMADFQRYLDRKLEQGYEGVILRSPTGPYKFGKATIREQWMLKVKPFEDFEARITGYYEEMENTNEAKRLVTGKINRSSAKEGKKAKGALGGFTGVEIKTGVEVRVGGGFTARERADFWARRDELVAAGAIMKCKKQAVGEKDKPRHPNFICLRPEWDVTE